MLYKSLENIWIINIGCLDIFLYFLYLLPNIGGTHSLQGTNSALII